MAHPKPLGRRLPPDDQHVQRFPMSVLEMPVPADVEQILTLPGWHWSHDQGAEGSCVGHGTAMERAITNIAQERSAGRKPFSRRYDPIDIWNRAKSIDEWPDTNPGDENGTSVRAGYDVMRTVGPSRVRSMRLEGDSPKPVGATPNDVEAGALVNRWATSVDEMRAALALGLPVTIGVNWYEGFDDPSQSGRDWWIGRDVLGRVRGGHCVCVYGASDRRQGFKLKNSWGKSFPLVWLPYAAMERLLKEEGEAALVVDR
jgi:hypothetical protein